MELLAFCRWPHPRTSPRSCNSRLMHSPFISFKQTTHLLMSRWYIPVNIIYRTLSTFSYGGAARPGCEARQVMAHNEPGHVQHTGLPQLVDRDSHRQGL